MGHKDADNSFLLPNITKMVKLKVKGSIKNEKKVVKLRGLHYLLHQLYLYYH